MPKLDIGLNSMNYEMIDHTLPWLADPEAIFFHHGVGANLQCWQGWAPSLMDRYRLVMFDLPGHGHSQPGDEGITIDGMVSNIIELADEIGCGKFHLVGESIGGTVALKAAVDHRDRLLSLTVSNGAHLGGSIQNLDFWHEMIEVKGMNAWSDRMMTERFFDGALSSSAWDWYRGQQACADPGTVLALLAALVGTDLNEEISAIKTPTLLLHPDSSPFIPVPVIAQMHEKMSKAHLRIFPHAKHGLPFSHADHCSATLRSFLNEFS